MGLVEILIVICVLGPLAGAVAHRIQRAGGGRETDPASLASQQKVERLQSEVDRLTETVERLVQQQDFLERLLEERPASRLDDGERNTAP